MDYKKPDKREHRSSSNLPISESNRENRFGSQSRPTRPPAHLTNNPFVANEGRSQAFMDPDFQAAQQRLIELTTQPNKTSIITKLFRSGRTEREIQKQQKLCDAIVQKHQEEAAQRQQRRPPTPPPRDPRAATQMEDRERQARIREARRNRGLSSSSSSSSQGTSSQQPPSQIRPSQIRRVAGRRNLRSSSPQQPLTPPVRPPALGPLSPQNREQSQQLARQFDEEELYNP